MRVVRANQPKTKAMSWKRLWGSRYVQTKVVLSLYICLQINAAMIKPIMIGLFKLREPQRKIMYRRGIPSQVRGLFSISEFGKVLPPTITTRCKVEVKRGRSPFIKGFIKNNTGGGVESYFIILFAAIFSLAAHAAIAGADIPSPLLLHLYSNPSFTLSSVYPRTHSLSSPSYCSRFNCRYKNGQMLPFDGEGTFLASLRCLRCFAVTQLQLKAFSWEKEAARNRRGTGTPAALAQRRLQISPGRDSTTDPACAHTHLTLAFTQKKYSGPRLRFHTGHSTLQLPFQLPLCFLQWCPRWWE